MHASLLDGKSLADIKQNTLMLDIAAADLENPPHLVVIIVGNNAASSLYVATKQKRCDAVGIRSTRIALSHDIDQATLLSEINRLNQATDVHGILVQLPLPEQINTQDVIEAIAPEKDVDGFHPYNLGRLAMGNAQLRPCTPFGIMQLLEHYDISIKGQHAVVIGCSRIVGLPMSLELLSKKATVTICHSNTKHLPEISQQADILISATGQPHMLTDQYVREDAIVIDVGISRLDDGRIVGDVDFDSVSKKASWITPVPGGVGPMTVTALLQNTWQAFQNS